MSTEKQVHQRPQQQDSQQAKREHNSNVHQLVNGQIRCGPGAYTGTSLRQAMEQSPEARSSAGKC